MFSTVCACLWPARAASGASMGPHHGAPPPAVQLSGCGIVTLCKSAWDINENQRDMFMHRAPLLATAAEHKGDSGPGWPLRLQATVLLLLLLVARAGPGGSRSPQTLPTSAPNRDASVNKPRGFQGNCKSQASRVVPRSVSAM